MSTPTPNHWRASRTAGLQHLDAFCTSNLRYYAKNRNSDQGFGKHGGVSRLSPWLRHRAVLEQEVIERVVTEQGAKAGQKFIQEVVWRSYWKGWLQHRPALWTHYQISVRNQLDQLSSNNDLTANYDQAVEGRTPITLFNSWVNELVETGYLHNHSRMWFASIWIFTLKLPWQLGADFFIRQLLDGDPASNTLSWRWVAGLHTSGKHYLATKENIEAFAKERAEKYPEGLDRLVIDPENATPLEEQPAWPKEAQALSLSAASEPKSQSTTKNSYAVLIHEDDCGHGLMENTTASIALEPQPRSSLLTADPAKKFSDNLLIDALSLRAKGNEFSTAPKSVKDVVIWARESGIDTLYTPFAPVGPTAQALKQLETDLLTYAIDLVQLVRPYDRLFWPHASKGFFKLNKKIPDLLSSLLSQFDNREGASGER